MLMKVSYVLLVLILIVVVAFVVFYKMSGKKQWFFKLNNAVDGKLDQVGGLVKVGDNGVCLSRLVPMGKAMFEGNDYEVTSQGEFIEVKTPVKVIGVLKNRITVTKLN
jgi:membrane-bound ClpP family serine protease